MKKNNKVTKILAVVGTIMVWIPLVLPILLSCIALVTRRIFLFDYLMPAELFLIVFIGGVLLYSAAFKAHFSKKMIGWSMGAATLSLVGGQGFAVITGAASGAVQTWQLIFIYGSLVFYFAFLIVLDISGIRLLRQIFHKTVRRRL